MDVVKIAREVASLPPEARKEVMDFISVLRARYVSAPVAKRIKRTKLADEPFVGMWRDREDMRDSTAWVRRLRQH